MLGLARVHVIRCMLNIQQWECDRYAFFEKVGRIMVVANGQMPRARRGRIARYIKPSTAQGSG